MDRWKPNVTVAAVIRRGDQFLMVEERTVQGLRINQPAGHLDAGESLVQAVERESLEETAHRVKALALIGVYMNRFVHTQSNTDTTYLRFAFLCEVVEQVQDRLLDQPVVRAMWMNLEQLQTNQDRLRSVLVLPCIEDCLAGKSYNLDLLHTDPSCLFPFA